mmetsp:Transcript_340/g.716  ORF Transcript_340/g.716 Transcript_340/m.716 type:complete len:158 (+) Transcript_340:109-582(+)
MGSEHSSPSGLFDPKAEGSTVTLQCGRAAPVLFESCTGGGDAKRMPTAVKEDLQHDRIDSWTLPAEEADCCLACTGPTRHHAFVADMPGNMAVVTVTEVHGRHKHLAFLDDDAEFVKDDPDEMDECHEMAMQSRFVASQSVTSSRHAAAMCSGRTSL